MIKNTVASHTETIRLEKIYAMADVAFKEGHVRFSASQACDHQRTEISFSGLDFIFHSHKLVRISGAGLCLIFDNQDIQNNTNNITSFSALKTPFKFIVGNDSILDRWYQQISGLGFAMRGVKSCQKTL